MTVNCHTIGGMLAPAGEAAVAFDAMWDAVWTNSYFSPALLECCRLTLAKMNRADAELNFRHPKAPADPARTASILSGDPASDPAFSPAERAVLEFAEAYGLDTASITDAQAENVKHYWGEPALVFLIEALGMIDSRMRLALMMPAILPPTAH